MRPQGSQGSTRPCAVDGLDTEEILHLHRFHLHAKAPVGPNGVKHS